MFYNSIFDNYIFGELDNLIFGKGPRKEKEREKFITYMIYLRQILAGACAMFDMENIPDGLDFRYLELFRYCNGHVGIMRHNEYGLVCFPGSFSGKLDAYGRGTEYVGALLSGDPMDGKRVTESRELKGTIGKDCVVIPNNYLYTADLPLFFTFAKRLTEVDTSIDSNVFFSRMAPIIKTSNGKVKAAIDEILADIKAGNIKSIISDDMEADIEGIKSIDIFNITDVAQVDKIQYLSKYHDDLLRRLYTLGGHSMAGTQKMAQQSAFEVGQNDSIAMIYPMERMDTLRKGIDAANNLFGTNMEVKYSEAWQVEKEKIESSIASANAMQSGETGADTEPELSETTSDIEEEEQEDEA